MAVWCTLSAVLIIATRNSHKTREIAQIVGDQYQVLDASDFPHWPEVAETGSSFLENATLKAEAISLQMPGLVLADDSGLLVDALHGAPGVLSSSYGGQEGHHGRNNERLLRELEHVPILDRGAKFRCVMVLAKAGKSLAHFCGDVEGRILLSPRGVGGFGYDPLFAPLGHELSFAELGDEIKNSLSHRARALAQATAWLDEVLFPKSL